MRRPRRLLAALACAVIALPTVAIAQEDTRRDLNEARERLDQAEDQLAAVGAQVTGARAALHQVDAHLVTAQGQLADLEAQLAEAQRVEAEAERRTARITTQLVAETSQLEGMVDRLHAKEDTFEARVAATFKYGAPTYAEAIVGATSFQQFLNSFYYVESALEYDSQLIEDIGDLVQQVAARRAEVAELRGVALEQEAAAERARDHVEDLTEQQSELTERITDDRRRRQRILSQLESTKQDHEALVAELEAESAALADQLRREQAEAAEAARRAGHAVAGAPGRGELVWPTDGSASSGYGYRTHPIYGSRRMHTGIDIPGPTGQPIVAAASGVVIHAGWRGGYGLAVVIDHGGGLATLYAHTSSIAVTDGQWVEQGQTVAGIGSTGYSTGPHLHFEVRVGGEPRDPMDWY